MLCDYIELIKASQSERVITINNHLLNLDKAFLKYLIYWYIIYMKNILAQLSAKNEKVIELYKTLSHSSSKQ